MNKINIIKEYNRKKIKILNYKIRKNLNIFFSKENIENVEINIYFCENPAIQELNFKYLKKKQPTDVLSFNLNDENPENKMMILGDIAVSIDKTVEQAEEYNVTLLSELYRLIFHGLLHLLGYNHITGKQEKEMNRKIEFYMSKCGIK